MASNNLEDLISPSSGLLIWEQPKIIHWSKILADSYYQLLGESLINADTPEQLSQALFHAPFVLVSHGTQANPIFNYANQTALQLWGLSWDEFTITPSASVTQPDEIKDRALMLKQAAEQGYIDNYQGIRIAKTGKKFLIKQVKLWNLQDETGNPCGQAATFPHWQWLE